MCLAIPGKIETVNGTAAQVDFDGVRREVSLALVPKAGPGDYVLVHAGFAIQIVDKEDAQATIKVFRDIYLK